MRRALIAAAALALAPSAARAETWKLSDLPEQSARVVSEGLQLPSYVKVVGSELMVGRGCLANNLPARWVAGADDLDSTYRWDTGTIAELGIENLVVRDGKTVLERHLVAPDANKHLVPLERGRIPVREVARIGDDLVVHAYRYGARIFVIAPTGGSVFIRFDTSSLDSVTTSPNCPLAITQLRIGKGTSQAVQIAAQLPHKPKVRFVIDASLSQTSRDPEPVLSVTARVLGR